MEQKKYTLFSGIDAICAMVALTLACIPAALADPPDDCCMVGSFYGDGADGDLILSGYLTLSRDMYFENVTILAGATLDTAGYTVYACSDFINYGTITDTVNGGLGGDAGLGGLGGDPCDNTTGKDTEPTPCSDGDPGENGLAAGAGRGGDGGAGGGGGGGAKRRAVLIPPLFCTDADGGNGGRGGAGGKGGGVIVIRAFYFENNGYIRAQGEPGGSGTSGEPGEYYEWFQPGGRDLAGGGGGGGEGGDGGNGGTVSIYCASSGGDLSSTRIRVGGGRGGNGSAGGAGHALTYGVNFPYGSLQPGGDGCGGAGDGGHGAWEDGTSSDPGDSGATGKDGMEGTFELFTVGCNCAVYHIKPDGSGDYATIQDAVDAAQNCDVIALADGIYTGIGNCGIDYLGKAITIQSESGDPSRCVIDCNAGPLNQSVVFSFSSGETGDSILDAVTVTGGHMVYSLSEPPPAVYPGGGGIRCTNGSSPTIHRCIISGNYADPAGGGISCDGTASIVLQNCTITNNIAQLRGGGIYNGSDAVIAEGCILWSNCAIEESSHEWHCDGGVIQYCCCDVDLTGFGGSYTLHPCDSEKPNLGADPLFCDPGDCDVLPPTNGNYHLRAGSPCENFDSCGLLGALPVLCEACCLDNGVCIETDPHDCVYSHGGVPQGAGSVCMPSEACCFADGTCDMFDPLCCFSLGGDSQGPATTCLGTAACCLPDGSCLVVDIQCCEQEYAGVPQGVGSTCDPEGACCLTDGECVVISGTCCESSLGGVYMGGGTTCDLVGACCLPTGECLVISQLCCESTELDGTFLGAGTGCTDPWFCIMPDESVIITTEACCSLVGGTFGPGEPIPTVSEWGQIILTLLLLTAGTIAMRKGCFRETA